jgi:hypothetical protein
MDFRTSDEFAPPPFPSVATNDPPQDHATADHGLPLHHLSAHRGSAFSIAGVVSEAE